MGNIEETPQMGRDIYIEIHLINNCMELNCFSIVTER